MFFQTSNESSSQLLPIVGSRYFKLLAYNIYIYIYIYIYIHTQTLKVIFTLILFISSSTCPLPYITFPFKITSFQFPYFLILFFFLIHSFFVVNDNFSFLDKWIVIFLYFHLDSGVTLTFHPPGETVSPIFQYC